MDANRKPTDAEIEALTAISWQINDLYLIDLSEGRPLTTDVPWDKCPEEYKDLARNGTRMLLENPNATCSQLHDKMISDNPEWAKKARLHPWAEECDEFRRDARFQAAVVRGLWQAVCNGQLVLK